MGIAASRRTTRAPDTREVRNRLSEAELMLGQASRAGAAKASRLLSRAETSLGGAVDAVAELRQNAVDRARSAGRRADDYVTDNPWRMVGAAATLGFLAAVFLSRRR